MRFFSPQALFSVGYLQNFYKRTFFLHHLYSHKYTLIWLIPHSKNPVLSFLKSLFISSVSFATICYIIGIIIQVQAFILIGFSLVSYNVNYVKYSRFTPFCRRFLPPTSANALGTLILCFRKLGVRTSHFKSRRFPSLFPASKSSTFKTFE
jgi:hypothetical protein